MAFDLHHQLEHDCIFVGRFTLCRVLLMNDKQYPWLILVPEVEGISEIYQLTGAQQRQLIDESSFLAEKIAVLFHADKMNIAAIGNLVPQLHIHHVVRYRNDPAWPTPVWGKLPAIPYPEPDKQELLQKLKKVLAFS